MWDSFRPTPPKPSYPFRKPQVKNPRCSRIACRWASCPRRGQQTLAHARRVSNVPVVGAGPSLLQVRATARTKTTRRTSQQRLGNGCAPFLFPHQEVQIEKPPVNEHTRVLFTVITLSQAALPLGRSACHHASESLNTDSAGPIASGAHHGQSHSGQVIRLVPFVVALRSNGRMTGCQPTGERVSTALPSRCGTQVPPCLELPPETPLPLSRDFYRHTGYPVGNSGHTPGHQLDAATCAYRTQTLGSSEENQAGNHPRSRLKPSPISNRHLTSW